MTTDTAAALHLSSRTWRPALLMAIVVASKVVYDEKVFLADYREQLPQCERKFDVRHLAALDRRGRAVAQHLARPEQAIVWNDHICAIAWCHSCVRGHSRAISTQPNEHAASLWGRPHLVRAREERRRDGEAA